MTVSSKLENGQIYLKDLAFKKIGALNCEYAPYRDGRPHLAFWVSTIGSFVLAFY